MNPYDSRLAALVEAVRRLARRPLGFLLATASSAFVLAALVLVGLLGWRLAPWEAPAWMQPEALVVVAGAEGEVDLAALRSSLRQVSAVASADFVGRDAALHDLAQRKGLAGAGLAELRPNPLPDAFRVRFAPGASADQVEAAVTALRKVRSVDAVEYQPELARRAGALLQLAGRLGVLLGALLLAALFATLLVAASFWSRADEAELRVLHRLGAELGAAVRPDAYASALTMLAAALLAWWIVRSATAWVEPALAELVQRWGLHWAADPLPAWSAGALCAGAGALALLLASIVLRVQGRKRLRRGLG